MTDKKIDSAIKSQLVGTDILSKIDNFEVTLFIPDINCPPKEAFDLTGINFQINPYNLKTVSTGWSEELDRKLKNYNFVIVQSSDGIAFTNCSVLPQEMQIL